MKKRLMLTLWLLLPFLTVNAVEQSQYQMPNTHVIPIKNTEVGSQYELYIKLPDDYEEKKKTQYPVIYFTDGAWHIELLSSTTFFMMEDVILVGISWQKDIAEDVKEQYGAHFSRYGDYSFKKTTNAKHPKIKFGQAEKHLTFIRNDVFKYVEKNYRTDPKNRSYFGFSAGGNFGAYVLMAQPDAFKNYLLGSPSVWQPSELLAQANPSMNKFNANVYISYGALEEKLTPKVEEFIGLLKQRNDNSLVLKREVIESAGHSDSSPMMAVRSIKWLSSLQTQEKE